MKRKQIARNNRQSENTVAENMRPKVAAQYLSCGLSTIWLYSKQHKITPIKLSDRVTIFKKEDLDNFIARGTK